jgi:hypothetical protein
MTFDPTPACRDSDGVGTDQLQSEYCGEVVTVGNAAETLRDVVREPNERDPRTFWLLHCCVMPQPLGY